MELYISLLNCSYVNYMCPRLSRGTYQITFTGGAGSHSG